MDDPANLRTISRLTSEYLIALAAEMIKATGRDPVDMLILNAISAANVAHLKDKPAITEPYRAAETPLPLELKRAIPSLTIAESLGLPRETCRRRVAALVKDGLLIRRKGGLVAVQERADPAQILRLAQVNAQLFRRLIRQMKQNGVEIS